MNDLANLIVQRRLLVGALVCASLLVGGYLLYVNTPWGHQLDDDAYLGRKAVSRKAIILDAKLLDHVSKAGLLVAALVLFTIAAARRCALVGLIAVVALGCAIIGAEFLKIIFHGERWCPMTSCWIDGFTSEVTQVDTPPTLTSLALSSPLLAVVVPSATSAAPALKRAR